MTLYILTCVDSSHVSRKLANIFRLIVIHVDRIGTNSLRILTDVANVAVVKFRGICLGAGLSIEKSTSGKVVTR